MDPYPQYLKALEVKTDGKGHMQAENQRPHVREGETINMRRGKHRPGKRRCIFVM
jgi:hypothetical protein